MILVALAGLLSGCDRDAGAPAADAPRPSPSSETPATSPSPAVVAQAQCVGTIRFNGRTYHGWGDLVWDPKATGRVETGTGRAADCERDGPPVEVAELADLPMSRAVLVEGLLYVRDDLPFPEFARRWVVPAQCKTEGSFQLRGGWLGVEPGSQLRPPYWITLHVDDGPSEYLGATIEIRVTDTTRPSLTRGDLKAVLWKGGSLDVRARCDPPHFVATGFPSSADQE